ncbi:hypothetical protein CDAR_521801 [Caerostris darwini]|uniref:Uncharacterized protein n=1 Tax=Caerostris darwini TaxID=1538125 RepID=A0AAV4RYZ9_9ARAC|nr:hypothetical protein CDAR_521801 [Caerostris darwini]
MSFRNREGISVQNSGTLMIDPNSVGELITKRSYLKRPKLLSSSVNDQSSIRNQTDSLPSTWHHPRRRIRIKSFSLSPSSKRYSQTQRVSGTDIGMGWRVRSTSPAKLVLHLSNDTIRKDARPTPTPPSGDSGSCKNR